MNRSEIMKMAWSLRREGHAPSAALKLAWVLARPTKDDDRRAAFFLSVREAKRRAREVAEAERPVLEFRAALSATPLFRDVRLRERRGGAFGGEAVAFMPPREHPNLLNR